MRREGNNVKNEVKYVVMKAAVPTILLSIIFNSLDSNNHVLRKSHSEINVHNIHPFCALRTDANKSHLSIPYNEVLAQSTKSPSCTPRRRGTVEKPPGFATFSASSTSANGATVIWVTPSFGHPHSQNPSNKGIPCNPNPKPNR